LRTCGRAIRILEPTSIRSSRAESCGFELIFCAIGFSVTVDPESLPVAAVVVPVVVAAAVLCALPLVCVVAVAVVALVLFGLPCCVADGPRVFVADGPWLLEKVNEIHRSGLPAGRQNWQL
jgi:hypothetical protein